MREHPVPHNPVIHEVVLDQPARTSEGVLIADIQHAVAALADIDAADAVYFGKTNGFDDCPGIFLIDVNNSILGDIEHALRTSGERIEGDAEGKKAHRCFPSDASAHLELEDAPERAARVRPRVDDGV